MKKIVIYALLMLMIIGVLGGCKQAGEADSKMEQDAKEMFESAESNMEYSGQFGFGVILEDSENFDEMQEYECNGGEVRIPYYVEGMDENQTSNFGILVFVDGVAQPYSIEAKEGEKSEEQYIHKFSLKWLEREEFDLVFTPVSGEEGEKVGFITASILEPDYMPESIENPGFGVYRQLSAIVPQEIAINSKIETSLKSYLETQKEDIPENITNSEVEISSESYDSLDDSAYLELLSPDEEESTIIYAKEGKATVKVRLYGGLEVNNRITFFVNNQPVQVNEADFIETKTEKGKMSTADVEIDTSGFEKMNSLYAVVMTTDSDYFEQDIFQSSCMLLVNE